MPDDAEIIKIMLKWGFVSLQQVQECQEIQKSLLQQGQPCSLYQIIEERELLSISQVSALKNYFSTATGATDVTESSNNQKLTPHKNVKNFGRYQVLGELGQGGMGKVYRVYDPQIAREVALKTILYGQNERSLHRFTQEAKMMGKLSHPNITKIYDIGTINNIHYFTMELIRGRTLSDWIKQEKIPVSKIIEIMIKVCSAMEYAHQQGIIHRDLKPSNIMVDANEDPFIMDFGLARDVETDMKLSQSGIPLGTASYMSPEQALGKRKEISAMSDVYSLGVILYEMLVGKVPFYASSVPALVSKIVEESPITPSKIAKRVPIELDKVCLKALAKKPEDRYATVADLEQDLKRFLSGEKVQAVLKWNLNVSKWAGKDLLVSALASLAVLLTLALIYSEFHRRSAISEKNAEVSRISKTYDLMKESLDNSGDMKVRLQTAELELWNKKLDLLIYLAQESVLEKNYIQACAYYNSILEMENAAPDNFAKIFEFARFQLSYCVSRLMPLEMKLTGVLAVANSHNERLAVVQNADTVNIMNMQQIVEKSFVGRGKSMTISPDGQLVALMKEDHVVLWYPDTNVIKKLPLPKGYLYENSPVMRISYDSRYLAYTNLTRLDMFLWDIQSQKYKIISGKPYRTFDYFVFSPDNKSIITGGDRKNSDVRFWEIATGKEQFAFLAQTDFSTGIATNQKMQYMFSSDFSGYLRMWDLKKRAIVKEYVHSSNIRRMSMTKNAKLIAFADENTIEFWSVEHWQKIYTMSLEKNILWLSFHENSHLLVLDANHTLRSWRINNCHIPKTLSGHWNEVTQAVFTKDNQQIITSGKDSMLLTWDINTQKATRNIATKEGIHYMALSPDNKILVTGLSDGAIHQWSFPALKKIAQEYVHKDKVKNFKFSEDSSVLVSSGISSVQIWHREENLFRKKQSIDTVATPHAIAISPDKKYLAFGEHDTVKIYSLQNFAIEKQFKAHGGTLRALEFSNDGKFLASGSYDRSLILWKWPELDKVTTFKSKNEIRTVIPSARDSCFLIGSGKGIWVWHTSGFTCDYWLENERFIWSLSLAPNKSLMVSAHEGRSVFLWEIPDRPDFSKVPVNELQQQLRKVIGDEIYEHCLRNVQVNH